MEKRIYESAEMEVVIFETADIITTSRINGDNIVLPDDEL